MNFWKSLVTADGEISSKRFSGLLLIGLFMVCSIIAAATGDISEPVESLIKTGLYTGSGLLGINVAESMIKTVARPKPVEDGDK